MMATKIDVVKFFVAGLSKGHDEMMDTIRRYFTPDTVYENVGMMTTRGIGEAIDLMRQMEENMGGRTAGYDGAGDRHRRPHCPHRARGLRPTLQQSTEGCPERVRPRDPEELLSVLIVMAAIGRSRHR